MVSTQDSGRHSALFLFPSVVPGPFSLPSYLSTFLASPPLPGQSSGLHPAHLLFLLSPTIPGSAIPASRRCVSICRLSRPRHRASGQRHPSRWIFVLAASLVPIPPQHPHQASSDLFSSPPQLFDLFCSLTPLHLSSSTFTSFLYIATYAPPSLTSPPIGLLLQHPYMYIVLLMPHGAVFPPLRGLLVSLYYTYRRLDPCLDTHLHTCLLNQRQPSFAPLPNAHTSGASLVLLYFTLSVPHEIAILVCISSRNAAPRHPPHLPLVSFPHVASSSRTQFHTYLRTFCMSPRLSIPHSCTYFSPTPALAFPLPNSWRTYFRC
ncbi:hypothetical protein R3P38DRAFT_3275383 [Favolaschia claudopus]|uniref:Uncharacterized protein n=1 Tax=Favolaschia claudopus TaxID=2862362 RepID=A0AAW0AUM5_9AGAR